MKLFAVPAAMAIIGLSLVVMHMGAPRMKTEDWASAVPYGNSDRYFAEYDRNLRKL